MVGINEETQRVICWGLPSALITLGALGAKPLEAVNARLLLIGDASYSIYLTHLFPLTFLDIIWSRIPGASGSVIGTGSFFMLGFLGSLAIGILCYRFVEMPLERIFRKNILRYQSRSDSVSGPSL